MSSGNRPSCSFFTYQLHMCVCGEIHLEGRPDAPVQSNYYEPNIVANEAC